MAVTIVGEKQLAAIQITGIPLIETKRLWIDKWSIDPSLKFDRAVAACAGQEVGTCEFHREYGHVKEQYAPGFIAPPGWGSAAVNLTDHWVRVRFHTDKGSTTLWIGRMGSEVREPKGQAKVGDVGYASGVQHFVAYEPAQYLENIDIAQSVWVRPTIKDAHGDPLEEPQAGVPEGMREVTLDWAPGMNARDERKMLVGNRFANPDPSEPDWFGGTASWTAWSFIRYLLGRFVDGSAVEGPAWTLGGQSELLLGLGGVIPMNASESVLSILRRIINPRYGIDFKIDEWGKEEDPAERYGFQVTVFALSSREQSFAGFSLPSNPDVVEIRAATAKDVVGTKIVKSGEHAVGRVRVLGARMICCTTLEADGIGSINPLPSLVKKWSDNLESAYRVGSGIEDDDGEAHDKARKADKFRTVFQAYGAPDDWDHGGGAACPRQDFNGNLIGSGLVGAFQNRQRKTLPTLPLRQNFDYSTDPPQDHSEAAGSIAELRGSEFLGPQAYLLDPDETVGAGQGPYVAADTAGMDVGALPSDWGVLINAHPNHLLGLNHMDPVAPEAPADTAIEPRYDWKQAKVTIAFHTDQRLELRYERRGGVRPQDGTIEIIDEDAELWFATPGTVFSINEHGTLMRTPAGRHLILRNDADRLKLVMAGAISRYFYPRFRAELTLKRLFPYSVLLGRILTVIEEGGDAKTIQAPITAVEYTGGDRPGTVIRAGYAK